MSALDLAARLIRQHEGLRLKVYDDATGEPIVAGSVVQGHPSIGFGRNLADRGISEEEADDMLVADLHIARRDVAEILGMDAFFELEPERRAALIDMAFNMGRKRFGGFVKMIAAIQDEDFDRAADEMLASKWAGQVGVRAVRLARIMRTGKMDEGLVA